MTEAITITVPAWALYVLTLAFVLKTAAELYIMHLKKKIEELKEQSAAIRKGDV